MDSLEQHAATSYDMPRFDDGMVNIQELIRIMAEALVNEIMDAQAEDACAEHARRIIEVMVNDNPIGRKAA